MERKWKILSFSFLISFSYTFATYSYPPMIPRVMEEFNLSHVMASLPMSIVVIAGIFLALPSWILLSKWGFRKMGIVGLSICSLGGLISTIGSSFLSILIGRAILGVGGIFVIVLGFSMVAEGFPSVEKGRAMGIKSMDRPLSTVIALNVLPFVIAMFGWEQGFTIYTSLLIFSTIVFILFFEEENPLEKTGENLFDGIWNKQMWLLGLIMALVTISVTGYTTWAGVFFIEEWGLSDNLAFFLASIIMITAIPLSPLIGFLSDKLEKRKIFLILASVLMGISFILIPLVPSSYFYLAIAVLAISSFGPPIIFALTSEFLPRKRSGLGFGILFTCNYAGVFSGPLIVGYIKDIFIEAEPAFLTMSVFPFLALIFTVFLRE